MITITVAPTEKRGIPEITHIASLDVKDINKPRHMYKITLIGYCILLTRQHLATNFYKPRQHEQHVF